MVLSALKRTFPRRWGVTVGLRRRAHQLWPLEQWVGGPQRLARRSDSLDVRGRRSRGATATASFLKCTIEVGSSNSVILPVQHDKPLILTPKPFAARWPMSALIFVFNDREIILAMDSLCTDPQGNPQLFTTKFQVIPHLNVVVCGTGLGGFSDKWAQTINTSMLVSDVLHLDHHTPEALRALARGCQEDFQYVGGQTTTIYQFGFPEGDGPPVGFAYRSTNDFASEPLQRGNLHLKPDGDAPSDWVLPNAFAEIMASQRMRQETRPAEARVHIGGDLIVCHMSREQMCIYRPDSFADKSVMMRNALERHTDGSTSSATDGAQDGER